ncbi:hypothetical protein ACFYXF_30340 [Streptomyces sp. NPDC002680]|uniref:hypothetical protein n=1 Tax=Streptomyces sp. NPDC002680 TaxID=3364659 RepID=UPI003691859E
MKLTPAHRRRQVLLGGRCTDRVVGRYTLACLTDAGPAKPEVCGPGHVTAVRRLIFDSLSPLQVRQKAEIARRIAQATSSAESL